MSASRNAWILGAVLLVSVLCSGCATPSGSKPRLSVDAQAEALSHFSLGLLAENSSDAEAALLHLKEAIRIDPAEKRLYPPAISAALQLNQPDEALRIARQLRGQFPDVLSSRLLEAQVCLLTSRNESAEELIRDALVDFPEETAPSIALARLLVSQKRTEEAIPILETARTAHADQADILHLLGTLYISRSQDLKTQQEKNTAIQKGIGLLEKSLESVPNNPSLWQQVGFAYLAMEDSEQAQNAFETAYELFPEDIQFAQQLLDVYILNGAIERALALCEELPRYTRTDPELWLQYLIKQLPEQYIEELTGLLSTYLEANPKAPAMYYAQLGSLYLDQKKLPEAETALQKAQTIYPEDDRILIVLGYLYLQQERYEEAYSAFNQLRTKSPDTEWASNVFFTFNLMVAAQKTGRIEEAAEALLAAYTKDPMILNQYFQATFTGEIPISTQAATDLLTRFQTLSPDTTETLYYLTLLQANQEKYEDALRTASRFKTMATGGSTNLLDESFYYQYAVLHERTGKLDEAEQFFRKAIDLGSPATVALAQNYIAYMWAERGEKLEMGLKLIKKALATEPDNAAFLDTLGWIYYMQGRYQEALVELNKASDLMNDDPTVWEHLGDTYLKLGDLQTAVQKWKKGLKLSPDQEPLLKRLEEYEISPDKSPAPADIPADTQIRP